MKFIDLRSDTVTQPTDGMRQAMLTCEVGDDVYRDDPTMNQLEELAAEMSGMEKALFVPSGTMGNQLAIMTHTRRGDEVIAGSNSHIVVHEVGAAAVLSSVSMKTVQSENDQLLPEEVLAAIRSEDIHNPPTGLICLENALGNGRILPMENMKGIYEVAQEHGIPVHTDGARLFNAGAALGGLDVKDITQYTDSVMFCLSKGLSAPVGSILAGSSVFIERARKNRKLLGGGMRQAGILAAAGIIALEEMTKRLHEDHENAKYFAGLLKNLDEIEVFEDNLDINMVFVKMNLPAEASLQLKEKLYQKGIKINAPEKGKLRFVTHSGLSKKDIETAAVLFKETLAGLSVK